MDEGTRDLILRAECVLFGFDGVLCRRSPADGAAVDRAFPTPYVDRLIRTWHAVGVRLAVTADCDPEVVRRYLDGRGLTDCFGGVHGRAEGDGIRGALRALGAEEGTALLVGAAPEEYRAARAAGVGFLGVVRHERGARLLRDAGAGHVVDSLAPVLDAVWSGARR